MRSLNSVSLRARRWRYRLRKRGVELTMGDESLAVRTLLRRSGLFGSMTMMTIGVGGSWTGRWAIMSVTGPFNSSWTPRSISSSASGIDACAVASSSTRISGSRSSARAQARRAGVRLPRSSRLRSATFSLRPALRRTSARSSPTRRTAASPSCRACVRPSVMLSASEPANSVITSCETTVIRRRSFGERDVADVDAVESGSRRDRARRAA